MSKVNVTKPADYKEVFQMVKSRVYEAQYKAYAKVNSELISLYWDLGKTIVEKQEQENWGDATVEQLAEDLQLEFKDTRGFNRANMFRIRKLFLEYRKDEKVAQLVRQIS